MNLSLKKSSPADAAPKHVIDEYKHKAQTIRCTCGWHGSCAAAPGQASAWNAHLLEMRGPKR